MKSESASLIVSRHLWLGLSFSAALGLAACATAIPPTFDLSPATGPFRVRAARGQLAVAEPIADTPIDSQRIVVRVQDDSIAYLRGAQWSDRLPSLVQTRLIETFENAHLLREVGRPGMAANYTLSTEIRRFELTVAKNQATVVIAAQLINASGRIVHGRVFTTSAPAPHDDGATATAALDQALGQVMREIVTWAAPLI